MHTLSNPKFLGYSSCHTITRKCLDHSSYVPSNHPTRYKVLVDSDLSLNINQDDEKKPHALCLRIVNHVITQISITQKVEKYLVMRLGILSISTITKISLPDAMLKTEQQQYSAFTVHKMEIWVPLSYENIEQNSTTHTFIHLTYKVEFTLLYMLSI